MNAPARVGKVVGWLLFGTLLTFALYLPVWFVVGATLHEEPHPDYWTWATPDHIFPIAAALSSALTLLGKQLVRKP